MLSAGRAPLGGWRPAVLGPDYCRRLRGKASVGRCRQNRRRLCRNTVSGAGVFTYRGNLGGLEMRFLKKVMAALVLATALLHAPGNRSLGATNCGFLTIEQCRASVSGIGGFCVPNQFYNPRRSAKDTRKRQEVRAYAMPYDPYPWCAQYSEGDM